MKDEHLDQLIGAHLDGSITHERRAELEQRLLHSASDRARFWQEAQTHAMLHAHAQATTPQTIPLEPHTPAASAIVRIRQWRPLAAAAAGLIIGLFSASLVFGVVVPSLRTRIDLLQEGFESGVRPDAHGRIPLEPGVWSGDLTEISEARGVVTPAEGTHMLRFLRADSEGHPLPNSFSSDTFQLLDLRPYQKEIASGKAMVRLSALFNGDPDPADGPFACVLKLYALDNDLVEERKAGSFTGSIRERMLAHSSSTRVRLDSNPQSWQRANNELRLPPGTNYLVVQVGLTNENKQPDAKRDVFGAHYVDRVQVVLALIPEVTLP
ncbi:MAG: hypothetical protein RLZZ399_2276 [Verrucomicrobiota bacterium]|jgi:hypothetical protein